jgi:hypothetical protein
MVLEDRGLFFGKDGLGRGKGSWGRLVSLQELKFLTGAKLLLGLIKCNQNIQYLCNHIINN